MPLVLQRVYINPDGVDEALVDLIHTPSGMSNCQPLCMQLPKICSRSTPDIKVHGAGADGALEAFVSVITGPPGIRPEAIFDDVEGPLLVLWGKEDSVTALDGPVRSLLPSQHLLDCRCSLSCPACLWVHAGYLRRRCVLNILWIRRWPASSRLLLIRGRTQTLWCWTVCALQGLSHIGTW